MIMIYTVSEKMPKTRETCATLPLVFGLYLTNCVTLENKGEE